MRKYAGYVGVAAALIAASAVLYLVHYELFRDARHIWIYLVGDLAFLPLQVVLVGLVVERLLERRERRQRMQKLNMAIGVFFSELGTALLGDLAAAVEAADQVRSRFGVRADWTARRFREAIGEAASTTFRLTDGRLDLELLRRRLEAARSTLLALLANPNLLEHEQFTDLLWAVFHLGDELSARPTLEALPDADRGHLAGDASRVFGRLLCQWLRYCRHLQQAYPYMFSIVVRTHPLQENPSPTVHA